MGSLSQDLSSYLNKSNNGSTTSLSSLTSKLSSMSLPTLNSIKSPFGGGGAGEGDEEPFLGVSSDSGLANNRKEERSWLARKMEENLPSLSKKQRIIGFMTSLILGTICFGLAITFLPMLLINPRKFSLLFTLGSVFTLSSFSFLWGPYSHMVHLFSKERLPFTLVYLTTLIATLYFAMGLQSAILTIPAAILQVIALLWFVISYIPGGQTGLKFFTKLFSGFCRTSVNRNLPV